VRINKRSPDIASGMHVGKDEMDVGAGDQDILFGNMSDETDDRMLMMIEPMLEKVDTLVIGGSIVFTFLKARGVSVDNSFLEEDFRELAKTLDAKVKEKGVELILPKDVACGDEFPFSGKEIDFKVVPADAIFDGWLCRVNGPEVKE